MKKKRFLSIILCLAMVFSLAACGGNQDSPSDENPGQASTDSGTQSGDQIVIKISHQNAITHPTQAGLEKFKELLEERSNGTMTCDIYDSAVLGNDNSNLQQVIAGSLDAAMIMGADIWQGYDKRAMIENLPFMFSTYEEARAAWDGEFGQYMKENVLEPCGGHVVNFWENGFRHFTNNTRPLTVPEDCHGIKFRTADNPLRLMMFEEFGASAIVLNFSELYSALQQGTVDGQENPLSNIISSCLYEVQDYHRPAPVPAYPSAGTGALCSPNPIGETCPFPGLQLPRRIIKNGGLHGFYSSRYSGGAARAGAQVPHAAFF